MNFIPINLFDFDSPSISTNVVLVFVIVVLIYYLKLYVHLAIDLTLFIISVLYTSNIVAQIQGVLWIAFAVFVIGWVFYLIGHKYEEVKPAFIDDLNQLLIGQLFFMAEIYFLLGFEQEKKQITPMSVDKSRALENECMALFSYL